MRSDRKSGFLFERGPNTLMVKGPALSFLRRHGLEDACSPPGRLPAIVTCFTTGS